MSVFVCVSKHSIDSVVHHVMLGTSLLSMMSVFHFFNFFILRAAVFSQSTHQLIGFFVMICFYSRVIVLSVLLLLLHIRCWKL